MSKDGRGKIEKGVFDVHKMWILHPNKRLRVHLSSVKERKSGLVMIQFWHSMTNDQRTDDIVRADNKYDCPVANRRLALHLSFLLTAYGSHNFPFFK